MASDYVSKFVLDSRHTGEDSVSSQDTSNTSQVLSQPSTYLRSRCFLCFGGNDWRRHRDTNTK